MFGIPVKEASGEDVKSPNLQLAMSPVFTKSDSDLGLNWTMFTIPQSLLLHIGTASILLLLTTDKFTQGALKTLGEASEELFRGVRLPILNFPEEQEINPN